MINKASAYVAPFNFSYFSLKNVIERNNTGNLYHFG